jgi:GWxTD domain-containing protein
LLHFLWQGSAVAIAYALLRRLTKRPEARYGLACAAIAAMALAPALTFFLVPGAGADAALWTISASEAQPILPVVVALWGIGVLAFSVRLLAGWRFTTRLRATSHPAPAVWQERLERIASRMGASRSRGRLAVSSLVNLPTVVGWLRPLILVPLESLTGMPVEQLTALLAHELAHIRRHDYLVSVLQSVAEAVLFYHPAVWWISEQIRVERELCCDDLAVIVSGDVLTYARALAALESTRVSRLPAANGGSLPHRIRRLIHPAEESAANLPGPGAAWAMTLLWLAGAGVTAVHGSQPPLVSPGAGTVEPLPISSRPTPFPPVTLLKTAKKTLAYDPILTAQIDQRRGAAMATDQVELPWLKWLSEDVTYIITDQEREQFQQLKTDEERESFVERFWLRRDPTPGTGENEFKVEHYRRIAYANARFATGEPGWKSDRGKIYITFGPPDEIDSHPADAYGPPRDDWRYRSIPGIGNNIAIEFVDAGMNGEYRMSLDPAEIPAQPPPEAQQVPKKFQNLENAIGQISTWEILPIMVRFDYIRLTGASVMTNITVQFENRDLQFEDKDGVQKSMVNILGRVSTIARRPVSVFERPLEIDAPLAGLPLVMQQHSIFQQSLPLVPGMYRLNIVAKDVVSGRMNVYEVGLNVPQFEAGKLTAGSLVLADSIARLPAGGGQGNATFAIGDMRVRPRLGNRFAREEKLGIYLQVYNFTPDEKTQKPAGSIEYEIDKTGSNEKVMDFSEAVWSIGNASPAQVTIGKLLPLRTFEPGTYMLKVSVTDSNGHQTVSQQADFRVSAE